MRALKKLPAPEVLVANQQVWTERYLAAKEAKAKLPNVWGHDQIRDALERETDSRCAYCDSHMSQVTYAHIEHYKPRSTYPELVVDWDNLTVACPRCNSSKSDTFSEDLPFITPFSDIPDDHFVFFGDLVLSPASQRGEYTIQVLGLNHEDLVAARRRRLQSIIQLAKAWFDAPELLKPGVLGEIRRQLDEGEYVASVRSLLQSLKIPL
ncbi:MULTISPECIES: HNH endonuclease [Micrococcaceae]|uniref:HNH endonuclease n=1 Tax=Micrococcaceae TaxID=1268 RepID=UPI0009E7B8F6|nr:HNH endonuclease [Arthrobacter sp. Soil761]